MKSKYMIKVLLGAMVFSMASLSHGEAIWLKSAEYVKLQPYSTITSTGFKLNVGVWPVAPGHSVGAVYSPDGWQTVLWTDSSPSGVWSGGNWCENVTGPFGNVDESWVVWTSLGVSYYGIPSNYDFALFVNTTNGTYWDNNGGNNYQVYSSSANTVNDGSYFDDCP